ncbi:hypothetical protein [Kluyvera intermedia]
MNRRIALILPCHSGTDTSPISAFYTSRCSTHFGASQDSRAGR